MAAWIGPAIQAVAGVVGSLFGGKSESKVNYRAMVREAELAGFNPLTVLRNGGAAGFTTQSSGTIGSRLAEGLAGVGNALTNYDPFEDKRRELETRVAEAQIANLNANTENVKRMSIGSVPSYSGAVAPRPFGATVKHGEKPAVETVLDGFKYRGSGKGGVIEDLWYAYRRPDGSFIRLPNPDIADGEQMLVPAMGAAENATTRPILSHLDNGGWITKRKLSEDEAAKYPWWPTFEFRWK